MPQPTPPTLPALPPTNRLPLQDENVLPPQFQAAMERVRAGADVMPRRQLEKARACPGRGLAGT